MVVPAAGVAPKIGRHAGGLFLLSLFLPLPRLLQLAAPLLLAPPDSLANNVTRVATISCYQFPAIWVDVCQLHAPFADILESQHWPSCWAVSRGKLTVRKVFEDYKNNVLYLVTRHWKKSKRSLICLISYCCFVFSYKNLLSEPLQEWRQMRGRPRHALCVPQRLQGKILPTWVHRITQVHYRQPILYTTYWYIFNFRLF